MTHERALVQQKKRMLRAGWIGILVLAAGVGGSCTTGSRSSEPVEPYEMTLEILVSDSWGALSEFPCGDFFSGPEFYASALRRDRKVESEYDRVRKKLSKTKSKIEAMDDRIVPSKWREPATAARGDDREQELNEARQEHGWRWIRWAKESRKLLERGFTEKEASLQRLRDIIPLSDEEVGILRDQWQQRTLLAAQISSLQTRAKALRGRFRMTTPGSLRVYPNDSVRVRLMEEDVGATITPAIFDWSGDDICATWQLRLDREFLESGGGDLVKRNRRLLRVSVRPVSP